MDSLFATILGLPVHPLVVHAVVVLLPLAALSLVACVVVPWCRERFAGVSLLAATVAVALAVVAKESGEWLAGQVGTPSEHARWADILVPVAAIFWILALAWYVVQRSGGRLPALVTGALMSLGALGVLGLVALVGHSGAQATWGDVLTGPQDAASVSAGPSPAPTPALSNPSPSTPSASNPSASTSSATASGITMAQVAQHASASSCWTAIDGSVYDLTSWVGRHPGGRGPIAGLCGTDGTAAFTTKHGTAAEPNSRLAAFRIGALTK